MGGGGAWEQARASQQAAAAVLPCSTDVARHLVALVDLVGDLEEDEQHDDHLDLHEVREEQILDKLRAGRALGRDLDGI